MSQTSAYIEAWLPGRDGLQFFTRTYTAAGGSPRGALVFVHGFAEHIARYEHVHTAWAARGFTVFAYDQRGYGRTALDKEHRSPEAGWSKTSWKDQLGDIEFWVRRTRKECPDVPLFLMGHSMGGALSIAFATREDEPPAKETVKMLAGIIVSSPLIILTHPPSSLVVWLGGKAATIVPHTLVPAVVRAKDLTHDLAMVRQIEEDPMVLQKGSLRQLYDFLTGGEKLLNEDYKRWPKDLPIFLYHGTDDKVNKYAATEEFYNKLDITDKKFLSFPGGYHELHNEPDGVADKVINEGISWAEAHLSPVPAKL